MERKVKSGLSKRNLTLIIRDVSKKHGVSEGVTTSMLNSVFKFFLHKINDMNDLDAINLIGLGRIYPGQVAKRNKDRLLFINEMIEKELKLNNINYEEN